MMQTLCYNTPYRHYLLQSADVLYHDTLQTLFGTFCRLALSLLPADLFWYRLQTISINDTLQTIYSLQTIFPCRRSFPADDLSLQTILACRQSPCRRFSADDLLCLYRRPITSAG